MTLVPDGRTARRMRAWTTLAVLVAASACGRPQFAVGRVVPHAPADSVELTLILIGDAGLPNPEGEPVLQALDRELERDPERTVVAFLGDNIYPVGLEDTTTERGQVGLAILRAQLAPLLRTGARGVFVPGNHDWAAGDVTGWNDIVRQERFLNDVGGGQVVMEPRDGCPGPVVMDVDRLLRLIAIDTQWWLHSGPRPGPDRCTPGTQAGVVDSLRHALATAGARRTVVIAHHPIVSGGHHGGYFDWPTYLFPFHPWARLGGLFANQDVTGREYRNLIAHLTHAFADDPPNVYAAGHEHNLQVFRRDPAHYLVVSGAGIYGHTTRTRAITGVRYIREASGYQRIHFLSDGRARLSVVVVDADGDAREDFSAWLDLPELPEPPPPPEPTIEP
jgi:hypothetical protein